MRDRHFCAGCWGGCGLEAPLERDLRGLRHEDEALEPGELMDVKEDEGPTDDPASEPG